jgi:putative SOS response-associated peptidase YedK
MCSHYDSVKNQASLKSSFNVKEIPDSIKEDMWPGYNGVFVRKQLAAASSSEMGSSHEMKHGSFGMISHWAKDTKISRHTYNARVESVDEKPSYREAWRMSRVCIIPADAIYEPDWRSGKAQPARIIRADHKPMGIAGLWSAWTAPSGETIHSYTMLTINADSHPLMRQFHKPTEEKRMVVILHDNQYNDWLNIKTQECADFLRAYPSDLLTATTPDLVTPGENRQAALF